VITSMTDRVDDFKRYQTADLVSCCLASSHQTDAKTTQHYSALRPGVFLHASHDARGIRVLCNVWRI
jgi:hypothetical protein